VDEKTFRTQVVRSSKDVIAFYSQYAATWDERFGDKRSTSEFHRIRLESFLKVAHLKKTDRLVELGVGTGPYLDMISPLVKEIICVDGSKQMLDILWAKHGNLPNITLVHMDLEQLIENVSFQADLVYCFGLLEHIIDANNFVKNCRSMLRTGGRVIFVTANGRSPWFGVMRQLWRAGRHCSSDRYYTRKQIDELMGQHGLAPEVAIYWGYCPAGVGDTVYWTLNLIGKIAERTFLEQYAGGLTVSYVLTDWAQTAAV